MGMKDNFQQAFKELLRRDEPSGRANESEKNAGTGKSQQPPQQRRSESSNADNSQAAPGRFDDGSSYAPPPNFDFGTEPETAELTVISKNTMISGNIRSFADLEIQGSIKGDVETTQDIDICGKIEGMIAGRDILMRGSSVQGNVVSQGALAMDKDSLLIGDITAQNAALNGKIKGNMQIGQTVALKPNAVVLGNVSVSNISIEQGAKIQGYINTAIPKETTGSTFSQQAPPAQPQQQPIAEAAAPAQESTGSQPRTEPEPAK